MEGKNIAVIKRNKKNNDKRGGREDWIKIKVDNKWEKE